MLPEAATKLSRLLVAVARPLSFRLVHGCCQYCQFLWHPRFVHLQWLCIAMAAAWVPGQHAKNDDLRNIPGRILEGACGDTLLIQGALETEATAPRQITEGHQVISCYDKLLQGRIGVHSAEFVQQQ